MPKEILVDSDILSYYMKKDEKVVKQFDEYVSKVGYVYIARITVFEILSGLKAIDATKQLKDFRNLLTKHKILEVTEKSVEVSSEIYAKLRKQGKLSGRNDILIAGIAITNDLRLCTNNTKDYQNIENLELINWK